MINKLGGTPFVLQVPCGQCAECQKARSQEYFFRSYYEALETFHKGGFVYMVTLTYDNEHLPHLSDFDPSLPPELDFPCFSRRDIRLFTILLREKLFRKYGRRINFKRFISTEYGTDDRFTHRPHIHGLFYVADEISPIEFATILDSCWDKGLTDGPTEKPADYVYNHIFSSANHISFEHLLNCCNYVAKYVEKDCKFQESLDVRIKSVLRHKYKDDCFSETARDYKRELYRNVNQFHLQSSHFGEFGVQYNGVERVFETGQISMPTNSAACPVLYMPLPTYFKRKFFYELVKDFRGLKTWKLTPLGVQFKLNRVIKSIDSLANTFRGWYEDSNPEEKLYISTVLANRSFEDFAEYILQWKGRIKPFDEVAPIDNPASLDTFVYLQYEQNPGPGFFANYTDTVSRNYFDGRILTTKWHGDYKSGFTSDPGQGEAISLTDFLKYYVINDSFSSRFYGFDALFTFYCDIAYKNNVLKQLAYKKEQQLKQIHKIYYSIKV